MNTKEMGFISSAIYAAWYISGCLFTMGNATKVNISFEITNQNSMNRVEWLMNKNLRS